MNLIHSIELDNEAMSDIKELLFCDTGIDCEEINLSYWNDTINACHVVRFKNKYTNELDDYTITYKELDNELLKRCGGIVLSYHKISMTLAVLIIDIVKNAHKECFNCSEL